MRIRNSGNKGSVSICSHPTMEPCFGQHTVDLKHVPEWLFPDLFDFMEHIMVSCPDKIISSFQHCSSGKRELNDVRALHWENTYRIVAL